jgi:hypothetical protein
MGKKIYKQNNRSKRSKRRFRGGMSPFVGAPLNYNNFSTYPGVTNHGGNHYAVNPWNNDLYTGNIIDESAFSIYPNKYVQGGKSKKHKGGYIYIDRIKNRKSNSRHRKSNSRHRKLKNHNSTIKKYKSAQFGGLAPLLGDAINGVENIGTSFSNVYNGLVGQPSTPSALPYIQPNVQMA